MADEKRDASYLWDMREAAKAILAFTRGRTLEDYRGDAMLRSAVERQVELIGEAARRVTEGLRDAHPDIPWRLIIAQRNVLVHQYAEIDDERVWRLVADHIPALIGRLDPLIPPPPEEKTP